MKDMPNVGRDAGILTYEQVKYVEKTVIEQVHEKLVGRQIMPLISLSDAGYKWYKYYEEEDMGPAAITMEGIAQADDIPNYPPHEQKLPVIHKTFMIQWRDALAAQRQGPHLLETYPRNAARQVAEEEDKLLLTGEYDGWDALGIEGLLQSAGHTNESNGNHWPTDSISDLLEGWGDLQASGFVGERPILIGPPDLIKCLVAQLPGTSISYREYIENNITRAIYETNSLFADDGGQDSVLLVIPGRDNFAMVEAQPPTVHWWEDKAGNMYGTVREVVAPVIFRDESIKEIYSVTCP